MTSTLVRLGGVAAILGGVLGIVLTPILTYLWATNSDTYGYFGRAYFLVFIGCLLGLKNQSGFMPLFVLYLLINNTIV